MEYMCYKLPRICSTCRKHFPVLSSFVTYHRVCSQINTTGVTSGAGTACPSGAPDFTPGFYWGLCYSIFSFICMFCRSLFVLLYFFFWPCCLFFFDIWILITPLVSSNSSVTCFWNYAFATSFITKASDAFPSWRLLVLPVCVGVCVVSRFCSCFVFCHCIPVDSSFGCLNSSFNNRLIPMERRQLQQTNCQKIMSRKTNLQVVIRKMTRLAIKCQCIFSKFDDVFIIICTDNKPPVQ